MELVTKLAAHYLYGEESFVAAPFPIPIFLFYLAKLINLLFLLVL